MRALNKKRASIEALQARLATGEDMNDDQSEKIQALAGVELIEGPKKTKTAKGGDGESGKKGKSGRKKAAKKKKK